MTSYQLPDGDAIEKKRSIEFHIPQFRIFHITSDQVQLCSPSIPGLLFAEPYAKCSGDTNVPVLRELGDETVETTRKYSCNLQARLDDTDCLIATNIYILLYSLKAFSILTYICLFNLRGNPSCVLQKRACERGDSRNPTEFEKQVSVITELVNLSALSADMDEASP